MFELLVPTAFVALMCLPKALVPDEKNHDVLYRSFSIGAGWNPIGQFGSSEEDGGGDTSSSLKGSGWQFTFTPITEETSDIVERAYVNFLCADSRSENADVKNMSFSVPRMVGMGWNERALEQMVTESSEDPRDLEKNKTATAAEMGVETGAVETVESPVAAVATAWETTGPRRFNRPPRRRHPGRPPAPPGSGRCGGNDPMRKPGSAPTWPRDSSPPRRRDGS